MCAVSAVRILIGGPGVVALFPVLIFGLCIGKRGHRDDLLPLRRFEQGNALRIPPGNPDIRDRCPDHLTTIRDQHDLYNLRDRESSNDIAIPVGGFNIDDPLSTAIGDTIFKGIRPLAIAVFGNGEQNFLIL